MVRKLGPIGNLLGMLPGAGQHKELLSQVNDKDLDRATAMIQSMTPEERQNPRIINGSGVTPGQVGSLIQNFLESQKQMKQMLGGGLGNVPGLPPGMRRAANKASARNNKKQKKRPGGDPRRAAAKADEAAAAADAAATGNGRGNGPGGLPDGFSQKDLTEGLANLQNGGLPGGLGGLPGAGLGGFGGGG